MASFNKITLVILLGSIFVGYSVKTKRSIDLSASHALVPDARLSKDILPGGYEIELLPSMEENFFTGHIKINLSWTVPTRKIALHAHFDLQINEKSLKMTKNTWESGNEDPTIENIPILRGDRLPKKTVYVVYLKDAVKECTRCELSMNFEGGIWKTTEGLFKGSYRSADGAENTHYLATYMRPNNARRLFPCFDEPSFKVPFTVAIARPINFVTLFNTPLLRTDYQKLKTFNSNYVIDHFEKTPPMPTFTFGFVISQLQKFQPRTDVVNNSKQIQINLWASNDSQPELEGVYTKLTTIYKYLEQYFNVSIPLTKIDVLAVPGLSSIRPADNWGLLMFKYVLRIQSPQDKLGHYNKIYSASEKMGTSKLFKLDRELLKYGYYSLAEELIYQWLGSWITPYWWSDAHVNKALASFLAANTVFEMDNGAEFNGKYPMTVLYSLYYEFSKRYPHSRITGMKQETTSYKTELVIRMLNYTLGDSTFRTGIRKFIADRHFGTFFGDDLWDALTKQATLDGTLPIEYSIADIAGSWITKDRLPVINVERDYADETAIVIQKVYLRERPHDVPERDKMLWWIPLVVINEANLNFSNTNPGEWMTQTRSQLLRGMPGDNKFIILNPEEIGPFPVNYDTRNWNMLSDFLQTEDGLKYIPTYTRAKLLHDAWNLAYAGDLSFATAFNMTLFMKFERNHIVWNPVFTFIDHIGRHIDISNVHKKFEPFCNCRFCVTHTLAYKIVDGFDTKKEFKHLVAPYSGCSDFCKSSHGVFSFSAEGIKLCWIR